MSTQTRKLCYRKDDRAMRAIYMQVDREPLRIWPFEIIQDGEGRHMAAAAILDLFEQ